MVSAGARQETKSEANHQPATTDGRGTDNTKGSIMRNIKIERTVDASRADVWAVLADYRTFRHGTTAYRTATPSASRPKESVLKDSAN